MRDVHLRLVEAQDAIEDRFTNVRRLGVDGGKGYFSLVFTVQDQQNQTDAVLKVFNPAKRTPDQAYRWECFERESRVLERLVGQRDIIQLISPRSEFVEKIPTSLPGVFYEIPFAYYVMEKGEGDISDAISNPRWETLDYLSTFHVMVRAVQRVHSLRLAHRDLKPDNFLLTRSGVKLSDFGTARFIDGTEPAVLANYDFPPGDKRYAAPELFALMHDSHPEVAFSADIFALGAILFEMFAKVNLGVQLFGPALLTDLTTHLLHVPRSQRPAIYRQIVGDIGRSYPLPSIEAINPAVPSCIRDRLNQLYKGLCDLDYTSRNCHFPSIFRQIQTCVLTLRNEAKIQRWKAESQKRRAAKLAREAQKS